MCVWYIPVYAHMCARIATLHCMSSWTIFLLHHISLLRPISRETQCSQLWLDWLTSRAPGSTCLCLSDLELQTSHTQLYVGARDPNWGPYVCSVSTLPMNCLPDPLVYLLRDRSHKAQWHIPIIPTLRRLRQRDCSRCKANLAYIGNLNQPRVPGLMVQVYNSITWEVEAGRSQVKGQPWLHNEFQANLWNTRHWIEQTTTKKGQMGIHRKTPLPRLAWNS